MAVGTRSASSFHPYPVTQQASKPASQQASKPASQQASKPASQPAKLLLLFLYLQASLLRNYSKDKRDGFKLTLLSHRASVRVSPASRPFFCFPLVAGYRSEQFVLFFSFLSSLFSSAQTSSFSLPHLTPKKGPYVEPIFSQLSLFSPLFKAVLFFSIRPYACACSLTHFFPRRPPARDGQPTGTKIGSKKAAALTQQQPDKNMKKKKSFQTASNFSKRKRKARYSERE